MAEKSGLIKTFQSLSDTTPTTFADLRTQVHNFSSRGLLGLAVDPGFPAKPYIYLYYTLDAPIGGTAAHLGSRRPDHGPVPRRHGRGQLRRVRARLARCASRAS